MAENEQTSGRGGSRFWVVPALTFLIGVVLGGAVIWATQTGGGGGAEAGGASSTTTSTSTSTTTGSPDTTITVPGECLQVADDSQKLLGLVNDAVGAVRDLDASKLSDVVQQMRDAQEALRASTSACREATGATTSGTSGASSPTSTS